MTKVIEAIYEDGVLKPLEKVDLKEGERVRIRIEKRRIYDVIREYQKYFKDVEEDLTKVLIEERR